MDDSWRMPTYEGAFQARDRIAPYLRPTPLRNYPAVDRLVGTKVWVKHENHQPTGAFKVRGGINLLSQLSAQERRAGVIAASTGNHGQSIAFGAKLFDVEARICVPSNANQVKVTAMQDLGAEVIFFGDNYDYAREHCEKLAEQNGYRYIHSGNEPLLIEGVGTHTLEILEEQPQIDVVIVPIGGGSGAAGACVVGKAKRPDIEVIGVQSEAAPAAFRSWKEKALVDDEIRTAAEGLACGTGFELPQKILWQLLDDFVLVTEKEIERGIASMIESTRNLVEAAAASTLSAAMKLRERLQGREVALICSGGNITLEQLRTVLLRGERA